MYFQTGENPQLLRPRNTVLLLVVVAFTVGIYQRNPQLIALGTMCLVSYCFALWQASRLLKGVNAERHHHPRAFQDNVLGVDLRITLPRGAREGELVLIEDNFTPATSSRVRRLLEAPVRPDEVLHVQYLGRCEHRRGIYTIGPVVFETWDPMGFFRRVIFLEKFTEVIVYPQAVDLNQTVLLGEGTLAHVGLETTPRTGTSEEFVGVREYRIGDSPRVIHWRSSARHQKLMVKEFQEDRRTLVSIFLDLGRSGLVGLGDQTSVEYGIKCCASLAKRAVELAHDIQLFAVGKKLEHIPPGSGDSHLLTILDRLAFLRAEGEAGFDAVVGDLIQELPIGSTAILLQGATTVNFDAAALNIARMLDRRILPVIVLIDDRAFIKIYREQELQHGKALPLEEITRQLALLGARVHVVRKAKSMEQALVQGLEREESIA